MLVCQVGEDIALPQAERVAEETGRGRRTPAQRSSRPGHQRLEASGVDLLARDAQHAAGWTPEQAIRAERPAEVRHAS